MRISLVATALGLLVGHGLTTSTMMVCNENNCLRAVQGSAYTTRHGTADCSSYLLATVTPATITVTDTVTVYTPSTVVQDVTATSILDVETVETIDVTATSTLDVTLVQTVDVTTTSTVDVTVVETDSITVLDTATTAISTATLTSTIITVTVAARSNNDRRNVDLQPRQVTVTPSSTPSYASACSGSAGYSSACSCIGVTKSTTTVATPTTTTTTTVTSPTFTTQITTDATVISTTIDSTSTFLTTDSTLVVTATDSTSTLYTIDATATIVVTDSTSIFSTTVTTATTVVSTTVTDIIPEATYYPQCAPSNLIGSYNGVGIIQIVATTSISIAAAHDAYDCCVACLTKPGCGAAGYASSVSQCYLIGDGGTCAASNPVGVFNTASTEAPNGGIIVSDTPCGKLVFGAEIG
ncbi:hypothetical protein MMC17_004388 [Xylographa soralifera]|nr:hypothetical protein [Xylographa soralifera]